MTEHGDGSKGGIATSDASQVAAEIDALRREMTALQGTVNVLRSRMRWRGVAAMGGLVALVAMSAASVGGWSAFARTAGDVLFISPEGNVGIGTEKPTSRLSVVSDPATANRVPLASFGAADAAHRVVIDANGQVGIGFNTISATGTKDSQDLNLKARGPGVVGIENPIKSPMWRVTKLFSDLPGPLPQVGDFTSGGGTLLILACGSGWITSGTVPPTIGMRINMDNKEIGLSRSATNEYDSHKAMVCAQLVTRVAPGPHRLSLLAFPWTKTDSYDFFSVTITEFPF